MWLALTPFSSHRYSQSLSLTDSTPPDSFWICQISDFLLHSPATQATIVYPESSLKVNLISCSCQSSFNGSLLLLCKVQNLQTDLPALPDLPPASLLRSIRHHTGLPLPPATLAFSPFLQWAGFFPSHSTPTFTVPYNWNRSHFYLANPSDPSLSFVPQWGTIYSTSQHFLEL